MQIITAPHPVLFKKATKITIVNKQIRRLIETMAKTLTAMHDPVGVGLAASQVGQSLRLFIIKLNQKSPLRAFINPEIVSKSKEMVKEDKKDAHRGMLEGCLSIPGVWGLVKRHRRITLLYLTEKGELRKQSFEDIMATIIQHEMDHLNGILFTSRAIKQGGKLYQVTGKDEKGKPMFQEIEL